MSSRWCCILLTLPPIALQSAMLHVCQKNDVNFQRAPLHWAKVTSRKRQQSYWKKHRTFLHIHVSASTDLRGLAPDGAPRPLRGVVMFVCNMEDVSGEADGLRTFPGLTSGLKTCSWATGEDLTFASLGYLQTLHVKDLNGQMPKKRHPRTTVQSAQKIKNAAGCKTLCERHPSVIPSGTHTPH